MNTKSSSKRSQHQVPVKAIFLDYDGTISLPNVSRIESRVAVETTTILEQLSKRIPIAIITSKDPWFIVPRTPFAEAWSTISGLNNIIGEKSFDSSIQPRKLELLAEALELAQARMTPLGIEVEEKRNSKDQLVAFCVDWRPSKDRENTKKHVLALASRLKALSLIVKSSPREPFFDVYAKQVDKGKAVKKLRRAFGLTDGILFMGDSKADNPAFLVSDVSVGVINSEGNAHDLVSDYSVSFDRVSEFLRQLFDNHLYFNSNFASLSQNANRRKNKNE